MRYNVYNLQLSVADFSSVGRSMLNTLFTLVTSQTLNCCLKAQNNIPSNQPMLGSMKKVIANAGQNSIKTLLTLTSSAATERMIVAS